ncbi:MAG: hypothetical protein IPG50_17530 [Myxococcales bacterium]|nr:hypothetical protein [Myxococcales bacterium]
MRPRFLVGAVAIAALTLSAEAAAQSPAAEALFREGVALLDSGDLKGACARFAESHKLEPSVGAAMNLGRCLERDGKNASAWASYLAAASSPRPRRSGARDGSQRPRVRARAQAPPRAIRHGRA